MAGFKVLSNDEFAKLSDEARAEYLINEYIYLSDNDAALSDLLDEVKAKQQSNDDVWSTGFQSLDEALDGGFMEGELISLGAISSLGKTSLALQIATAIAEADKDTLIFSLEMSKKELNAKTISRYSHIIAMSDKTISRENRLTHMDILKARVGDLVFGEAMDDKARLFMDAYAAAQKIAQHVKIVVGNNDISVDIVRDMVERHILSTGGRWETDTETGAKKLVGGRRPFVVCDYLQILQPSENAETKEKRLLTDYDISTLKTIARDFRIPVLTISAFNRTSYLEPVSMSSFRESSGIEYSSDIVLAMQYEGMDYQKHWFTYPQGHPKAGRSEEIYESKLDHDNRVRDIFSKAETPAAYGRDKRIPIQLKMLKRRLSPKKSLEFTFIPAYNYFEEGMQVEDRLYKPYSSDKPKIPAPEAPASEMTAQAPQKSRAELRRENFCK